jgi:hypothetical protein
LIAPNWASEPQNHPKAKVAVSILAGAARSMGGLATFGTEPFLAGPLGFLNALWFVSSLFTILQAFENGTIPRQEKTRAFRKARLLKPPFSQVLWEKPFEDSNLFRIISFLPPRWNQLFYSTIPMEDKGMIKER